VVAAIDTEVDYCWDVAGDELWIALSDEVELQIV